MSTFTLRQTCEAGHVHTMRLVDYGTRRECELLAALMDGSLHPDIQARAKERNDPQMRIGRCNLNAANGYPVIDVANGDKTCDAWSTCVIEDGDTTEGDPTASVVTRGANGSVHGRFPGGDTVDVESIDP